MAAACFKFDRGAVSRRKLCVRMLGEEIVCMKAECEVVCMNRMLVC